MRLTLAIALTVSALSTAAFAQSAEEQQACMNDAFRVCSATIPDRARTTACMIQKKSQLSSACQAVMAKYAPPEAAPVQTAADTKPTNSVHARTTTRNVSLKPVRMAGNSGRPGKPLNILMR
jgi:hypothetical protein